MKRKFLLLVLVCLLLCGCGEEDPQLVSFEGAATLPVEQIPDFPVMTLTEGGGASPASVFGADTPEGRFHAEHVDEGWHRLEFDDAVSGETYPLCTRPNCTHDSPDDCAAFAKNVGLVHYDGEHLYFVGKEENSNVECLFRQNIDGSDRQIVLKPTGLQETAHYSMFCGVFRDDKFYYTAVGTIFDPETAEIDVGEKVCIGDLTTGKIEVIPIEFNDGSSGNTLNIIGIYGNELVLKRHTGGEAAVFNRDAYHETFFLLDVDTHELTVLLEVRGGQRSFSSVMEAGLICFQVNDGKYDVHENVTIIGAPEYSSYSLFNGEFYIVDLSQRKILHIPQQKISSKHGMQQINGECYWCYLTWNEDLSEVTCWAQSVATGEVFLYCDIFQN